ncbi:hypothetical protein CEXT_431941 [Caerostris extrusa]|uniref:Uncharacterized protein n=1 Tax=Caerostris extrusa TaxID=172846 RepID=A0AAV4MZE0_CAEEX|nr:hypothetical protein CEXT_431941 [Caerostris extrusa]
MAPIFVLESSSALPNEIVTLWHKIVGSGFNTFSHDNSYELLVDYVLWGNDIIELTLDIGADLESDYDEEEKPTLFPFHCKMNLSRSSNSLKLENPFLVNDPNYD